MSGAEIGDPGGARDDENLAPDAPGKDNEGDLMSPAGMELTFETPAATTVAVYESHTPETVYLDPYRDQKKTTFVEPLPQVRKRGSNPQAQKPNLFREQFDQLMKRLEDRFQNERLSLEEKHCRELEEAMGYFSLSSNEREVKQQELQFSLLEDIGNMAQQLQELTGALGSEGDAESLTLPSDPKILEDYAQKMQKLEDQFQREKVELEKRQASEMEAALGTIKMSREQREAKQLELQEEISAEIGDMAKQLEDLNKAKEAYESKMGMLKQQLSKDDSSRKRAPEDPQLQSISQRLSDVERERDAAQEELRRLKLALKVADGETPSYKKPEPSPEIRGRLSPLEQNNISSLRGRIDQMEKELKEAAQIPGGSDTMRGLRERMKMIENDLEAAEESTKEHFALGHLRARMEKVEKLLTEGERAARDWEALEELRTKIGNVDSDLKAVEEAKREFEALETLRGKMEAVEDELRIAERLASDRENVDNLRRRLVQVERELGVAEPRQDDPSSIDKLLDRLAKAEHSLQDARASTIVAENPYSKPASSNRRIQPSRRDDEVEKILERLALAEKKLSAAKESALRRNPNTSSGYPNFPTSQRSQSSYPQNRPFTPFDEREAKIRARLQEHFDETGTYTDPKEEDREKPRPTVQADSRPKAFAERERFERAPRSKFEEPRTLGGISNDRYYVQQNRGEPLRTTTFDDGTIPTQDDYADEKYGCRRAGQASAPASDHFNNDGVGTTRPLRRRFAREQPETVIRASNSMPYSVIGDDEDRYAADLEELRYQRAMLAQKLPKNRFGDEEKKSEEGSDTEQKYSWKNAIRNEEKQLLLEKMNPRVAKKSLQDKPLKEAKDTKGSGRESPDEPTAEKIANVGGDPPIRLSTVPTGDPPPQVLSLEKDLKNRILSQPKSSGLEPREGNGVNRCQDPPAHVDPLRFKAHRISSAGGASRSSKYADEKSVEVSASSTIYSKDESISSRPDASVSTPAEVSNAPEPKNNRPWWKPSNDDDGKETKAEPPPIPMLSPPASTKSSQEAPQSQQYEPPQVRVQNQPPQEPPSPPPRQSQASQQPPDPLPPRQSQPPELPPSPPPPRPAQPPQPPPSPPMRVQRPEPEQSYAVPSTPSQEPQQRYERQQALSSTPAPAPAPVPAPAPPSPPPLQPLPVPAGIQSQLPPQQPIFHQTTVVDGRAAARERRERDKLMRWLVVILLCIAIILAVVIIVVIVLLRNDDTSGRSSAPTPGPAIDTPSPSMSEKVTLAPSLAPTPGRLPPTFFRGCPKLEGNRPLATDGVTSDEDTLGASYDASVLSSCGVIDEPLDNGVWYALIGAGETVTVSTCTLFFPSFDTQVVVYKPAKQKQGCRSGLDCVVSNDNFCGLQSSVTFAAQSDTLYFIYVSGVTESPTIGMNASEGEFSLTVSTSPEGSCQGAKTLDVAPSDLLPVIMVGDLLGGTFGIDPCNPKVETRTGELWYKVVGTGQVLVASTCHAASNFNARLAVYRGECDDLLCITSDDEDCGNGSMLSWFAETDQEYFLLVYSPVFTPDASFGITVQEAL